MNLDRYRPGEPQVSESGEVVEESVCRVVVDDSRFSGPQNGLHITALKGRGTAWFPCWGDNAPTSNAAGLHPWAWEAARSLWQSGHFREAVRAAPIKINAETQTKLDRRDMSEAARFRFAFSNDAPAPGKARLRPAGDDDGRTPTSLRRGIAAFAEGCFAAIRNPLNHDEGEMLEQEALKHLAAFSVLARWIDASSVVSV